MNENRQFRGCLTLPCVRQKDRLRRVIVLGNNFAAIGGLLRFRLQTQYFALRRREGFVV
jgi:hypothetical protein